MTSKQMFHACVLIAPNFRVGVEFTTLQQWDRALMWRAKRPADREEKSAGVPFPENSEFEPKLTFLLQQALATLQGP